MILEPVYLYCERAGPGVFAEPLNLAATLAFLVSGVLIWRMSSRLPLMRWMAVPTCLLFPGTAYLHMAPSILSLGLTIATIVMFVLVFFFAANRDIVGLSGRMASVSSVLILPFTAVSLPLIGLLPGASGSAAYVPLAVLLLGYAAALRAEHPEVARGLLTSALILGAALALRSADLALCGGWPYGTHFLWMIGAAVLSWHMAWVYRCHMLAGGGGGR